MASTERSVGVAKPPFFFALERGRDAVDEATTRFRSVRVPREMDARLRAIAAREGNDWSSVARRILSQALDREMAQERPQTVQDERERKGGA